MFNPYQQNIYSPYLNPQNASYTQQNMQGQQLIRVSGLDGAKAYQMSANSTSALFDNNEDLMYIKTTDGAGFPTIRVFRFEEVQPNAQPVVENPEYVTRKELEDYVKQFISESNATSKQSADGNDKKPVSK